MSYRLQGHDTRLFSITLELKVNDDQNSLAPPV